MLKNWPELATIIAFIVVAAAARADGGVDDLERLIKSSPSPIASVKRIDADDALRLTSNKDEIIRLEQDAASVIVNNPVHATVMLDSPRLLIVMPRLPGTTSFSVLNSKGDVILNKDIIVSNVQQKYVRIRRICSGSDASCVPAAYYYCPDGCYEVTPVAPGSQGNIPPPAANAAVSLAPAATTTEAIEEESGVAQ